MTIKLNSAGGGSVSIDAPNTGSTRTLTLPDKTATISPRMVLEQFFTPCDGSVIATSAGNITIGDVDSGMDITTSYADVTGSSISYTPPAGTTQVIYEFNCHSGRIDATPISHWKFFVDSDEVTDGRATIAGQYRGGPLYYKWGINIGGSAVTATGRQASWSSAKTLKLQVRDYAAANESKIHNTFYWDGGSSGQFVRPCIGITAIG